MSDEPLAVRLRGIFAEELEEQLTQLHLSLAALQSEPADREQLSNIFRVIHTLKGASRAAGVPLIEQVCHALETELARARDAGTALESAQLALLLQAADAFGGAREQLSAGVPVESAALASTLQQVRRIGGVARKRPAVAAVRAPERVASGADPSTSLGTASGADTSTSLGKAAPGEVSSTVPGTSTVARTAAPGGAPRRTEERVAREDQLRIGVHDADAVAAAAGEISVLASALSEHASEVSALRTRLRSDVCSADVVDREIAQLMRRAGADARTLASIAGRLHAPMRHLRQRPLRDLTDTLERVARDVAREVNKQIDVTTEGDAIEADRVVIEALRDPMLQLMRNAVDHGIETPEARVTAGKTAAGHIRIALTSRGDRLRLAVEDDGGGLDLSSIARVLTRDGRAVPRDTAALARTIFDDGFTTRDAATTLSGRGVGLGIVRATAERLGGTADVETRPGRGTTFTLDVPLSISTLRGVLVAVGGVVIALPSAFVAKVAMVNTQLLERVDGTDVMLTEGPPVPIVPLAALLGPPYGRAELGERAPVVIVEAAGQRIALIVDELIDERELVMRPLEYVGRETVATTVGVALVGTGDPVLVLSVPFLLSESRRAGRGLPTATVTKRVAAPRARILVVDDSITSRTLEHSVLAAAGYDVVTAVDGAEAWRLLERAQFSLVVSDVEMPNLDGIGLCERIRSDERTALLPVILVTSLDEPAHRARGLDAGADAYVAKSSFDQDDLLDTVRSLLGRQDGVAR